MTLFSRFVSPTLFALTCVSSLLLTSGIAHAQVLFSLSPSNYTIANTGSVTLTGYITNNTAATFFINDYKPTFDDATAATFDKPSFFGFVPASLAPGASYGSVDTPANIVTIRTNNAPSQPVVNGNLIIEGGADANDVSQLLGASFTFTIIPEAGAVALYATGLLGVAGGVIRRRRTNR